MDFLLKGRFGNEDEKFGFKKNLNNGVVQNLCQLQ